MTIGVPDVHLQEGQTDTDRDLMIVIQDDVQEVPTEKDRNPLKNHVTTERKTRIRVRKRNKKRRNRKRMRKSLRDARNKYCC